MSLQNYFLFTFFCLLLISCKKESIPVLNSEKEILEFTIEKEKNATYINQSFTAAISGTEIMLALPQFVDVTHLVASFEYQGMKVEVDGVDQTSGETPNDFTTPVIYTVVAEDGTEKQFTVEIDWQRELGSNLPHIFIFTDGGAPIDSKDDYVNGNIQIEGNGGYEDFQGSMRIKGRGNLSWTLPKKPYKIKLDSKASLLGLPAYKEWILLAEYLDGSMLYNSVPYTVARQLGIPFTNHIIPVEVTVNGHYQGFYVFTEQKEVGKDRIDIGDDGLLLEMDSYYDEEWKFKSTNYKLPVTVQFPEAEDMNNDKLTAIKRDFNEFEQLVFDGSFPDNNYLDYFDDRAFADYMIVYYLTFNAEINHSKSTYINKLSGGKYRMGIIWDFDYAFGYGVDKMHYQPNTTNLDLLSNPPSTPGSFFFSKLMGDPHMKSLFKQKWNWFRANKYNELVQYVKDYSELVDQAFDRDHEVWGKRDSSGDLDTDLSKMLSWLDARANYLDDYTANW